MPGPYNEEKVPLIAQKCDNLVRGQYIYILNSARISCMLETYTILYINGSVIESYEFDSFEDSAISFDN
jgi:hypothetical protein